MIGEEGPAASGVELRARLLDALGEAVIATDPGGQILYVNRAAEALYGWSAAELVGREVLRIIPAPASTAEAAALLDQLRRGEPWSGEFLVRRKDGSTFVAWVHDAPVHDERGELVAVLGISRDLSAMRSAEADRRKLAVELERAMWHEAVARLATGVAHDFNNLLAVIGTHAELVRERLHLDEQARDDLDEIASAVRRAALLTRQLLAYARQEPLETAVLDLAPLVSRACARWAATAGPSVRVEVAVDATAFVRCDARRVEEVVRVVLDNADEAMPSGGCVRVRVGRAVADEDFVAARRWAIPGLAYAFVEVTDAGVGMDEHTLDRAFEPFFSTKELGRGLGLSTVFGIALQHEGMVEAQSAPGRGSAVTLWLPTPEVLSAARARAPTLPEPPREESVARVLLVEDDEAVRLATAAVLRRRGHHVVSFAEGQDAVGFVAGSPSEVDVALLDLMLPGAPGWEVAARVHALAPHIRIVLASGRAPGEQLSALRRSVPFHYLSKPVSALRLCQVVESIAADARRARRGVEAPGA